MLAIARDPYEELPLPCIVVPSPARIGRAPAVMPPNAAEILAEWRIAGGKNYRALAKRLGVNAGTAHRYARIARSAIPEKVA